MAGAFAAGEADYTTAFEPTATQLEKEGAGYIVASVGQDAGEIPFTCYSATKSYMDKDLLMPYIKVNNGFNKHLIKKLLKLCNHSLKIIH